MPKRMLRDWTNSEQVDKLTWQAEVFFTRLIMKVDDYGRFYADPRLLKATLFPRRLDRVRDADITRWIAECEKSGLIAVYEAHGKTYLEIKNFGQKKVHMKADHPPPEVEVEENIEIEIEAETPSAALVFPFLSDLFLKKWELWRDYKKKEFRFKFKSIESEQASLNHLKNLAGGDEKTAIAIIDESMANTWKGFFELKVKPVNGFRKVEAVGTYIPPKPYEPEAPIVPRNQDDGFQKMIDADVEKIKSNPESQIVIGAKKLDWLMKKGKLTLTEEQRGIYQLAAEGEFLQSVSEAHELIANRAKMDYYKLNKTWPDDDLPKIRVIAKELAYREYLKSFIQVPVEIEDE